MLTKSLLPVLHPTRSEEETAMSISLAEILGNGLVVENNILYNEEQPRQDHTSETNGSNARLYLLYKVGAMACSAIELSDMVEQIMHLTETALNASASSMLLFDTGTQELFFRFADGPAEAKLSKIRLDAQSGIAGWVARHGQPLIVNDVTKDHRFCPDIDKITGFITKSIICAPLLTGGKVIGIVEVLNKFDGSEFEKQDLELLVAVASIAAIAIEVRQVEDKKRKMEEQLQIAGRLAAVGELTAGITHELTNPLSAIQGFAQFLAQRDDLDEAIRLDMQTIYEEAQRTTKVIANLQSIAYRHQPEKKLISINDLLSNTFEIQECNLKINNIEIVMEQDTEIPWVAADHNQIRQVFIHIINNAVQAMAEAHGRGKLIVRTTSVENMVQITFTDNGPGISEENLLRVFDPFFTTKDVGKGTGLGLTICFGIIQDHDGHLYVRSNPSKGTTFVVEIPVAQEDKGKSLSANIRRSRL
jgi:signal transduction histidine kinase